MWALSKTATQDNDKNEGATSRPAWNFVRHLLEMVLAMAAGMMLLGGLVSLVALALGQSEAFDDTSVEALIMTVNMTIGMVLWMRHRGHSLPQIAEMAGAMFVPFAVLIYPFWAGLITRGALMGAMHILMLPAMVSVMLFRRDIFTPGAIAIISRRRRLAMIPRRPARP